MESTLSLAFGAGLLSVVNPCALGMIPAYLALRAGSSSRSTSRLIAASGLVIGFVGVFATVSLLVAAFGHALLAVVPFVAAAIGVGLFVLGVLTLLGRPLHASLGIGRIKEGAGRFGVEVGFGATYALASLGCALPIFLAFGAIALTDRDPLFLVATAGAFAGGAAVMLLALVFVGTVGVVGGRSLGLTRVVERYVGGAFLIVAGLYILYLQLGFLIGYPFGIPVVTLPF